MKKINRCVDKPHTMIHHLWPITGGFSLFHYQRASLLVSILPILFEAVNIFLVFSFLLFFFTLIFSLASLSCTLETPMARNWNELPPKKKLRKGGTKNRLASDEQSHNRNKCCEPNVNIKMIPKYKKWQ